MEQIGVRPKEEIDPAMMVGRSFPPRSYVSLVKIVEVFLR